MTAEPKNLKYHNRRVAITKEISFDAAHHLEMYEGKCQNIHGHTYKLSVTLSGYLNEAGMVIDFFAVKNALQELITGKLDHNYLNFVLPELNPTVDNLVVWIWEQLERYLKEKGFLEQGCRIEEIKLFETPDSYATLKREWMLENG